MLKSSVPESSATFVCELCYYNTSRHSQYIRHINTSKHQNIIKSTKNQQKSTDNNQNSSEFICNCCGKKYKERSGLWRHKKICKNNNNKEEFISTSVVDVAINNNCTNANTTSVHLITPELVVELIKDNKEMKQLIVELVKNGITNTNNSHNTNCNNKTFNLQVFLNETCKDAMNITDFIDSIKLDLSDLMKVGEVGYVEGISNIITSNLKALDVTKRPVHCTDKKREIIYIKDEDKWEKDENKTKLKKVINKVSHKNIKLITEYREKYPECRKSESNLSDRYNKMIIEAMGGPGDNNKEKEEKIIKNISKYTTIEKYSE
jgi:hypothetical protein